MSARNVPPGLVSAALPLSSPSFCFFVFLHAKKRNKFRCRISRVTQKGNEKLYQANFWGRLPWLPRAFECLLAIYFQRRFGTRKAAGSFCDCYFFNRRFFIFVFVFAFFFIRIFSTNVKGNFRDGAKERMKNNERKTAWQSQKKYKRVEKRCVCN